jgi:hypothetical protein
VVSWPRHDNVPTYLVLEFPAFIAARTSFMVQGDCFSAKWMAEYLNLYTGPCDAEPRKWILRNEPMIKLASSQNCRWGLFQRKRLPCSGLEERPHGPDSIDTEEGNPPPRKPQESAGRRRRPHERSCRGNPGAKPVVHPKSGAAMAEFRLRCAVLVTFHFVL